MTLQFKKGEKVVYPAHGVAVIDDIQVKVISGTERRFYVLKILGTEKMTIMIPDRECRFGRTAPRHRQGHGGQNLPHPAPAEGRG